MIFADTLSSSPSLIFCDLGDCVILGASVRSFTVTVADIFVCPTLFLASTKTIVCTASRLGKVRLFSGRGGGGAKNHTGQ